MGERSKPGQLSLTSKEVEWLYAHLRVADRYAREQGAFNLDHVLHHLLDKLDRARFPDAVEVLIPDVQVRRGAKALLKKKR